jgi:hypothetical protein
VALKRVEDRLETVYTIWRFAKAAAKELFAGLPIYYRVIEISFVVMERCFGREQ